MKQEFLGYPRPDGQVGARNLVAIIPANRCSNEIATRIAEAAGPGVVALTHNFACAYLEPDRLVGRRAVSGLGRNPNVAATVVVGTSCETVKAEVIAEDIALAAKPLEVMTLRTAGSYDALVSRATTTARQMRSEAAQLRRELFSLSYLRLGLKCGGSGAVSAIGCNPVAGYAADAIIGAGGTAVFSETAEIIGAEHILARRATTEAIGRRLLTVVAAMQQRLLSAGVDILGSEPTPGNIEEGLSTLEEKSLGAIAKAGKTPLQGVLEWGATPSGRGLYFMDGSANTPQMYMGLAAAGCQVMTFGFAGGYPAHFQRTPAAAQGGTAILPVVKILSSPKDASEKNFFDIYLGQLIAGEEALADAGERLLKEIIATASGKPVKMEMLPPYQEHLEIDSRCPTI